MAAPQVYSVGVQTLTTLTGTERITVDNGYALEAVTTPNAMVAFGSVGAQGVSTNAAVASTTLTAANISAGTDTAVLLLSGTLTGAANATLPTVASLYAALPNEVVNQTYVLRVINASSGAFTWTIVTNTGWTTSGTLTVAQNTWRDFIVQFTSTANNTATITSIGTGTYS